METMNTAAARRTHPMLLIAAVAVSLFSVTGIAALMGWLPQSHSTNKPPEAAIVAQAPIAAAAPVAAEVPKQIAPVTPAPVATEPQEAPKKVNRPKPVVKPVPVTTAPRETAPPVVVAQNDPPAAPATIPPAPPVPAQIPREEPRPVYRPCPDCAVVESVRQMAEPGQGTGVGAIGGAVAGGVLGHQVGNGRGKDVATVLGAIGGAIAGHQVEKQVRHTSSFEIEVRFEDGSTRVFQQPTTPVWKAGDRVRVVNGVIRSPSSS